MPVDMSPNTCSTNGTYTYSPSNGDESGGSSSVQESKADSPECERQVAEATIADTLCVGSAIWTVGSLPSVLGGIGGAIVTAGSCAYAALEAGDVLEACGPAPSTTDPMAMERPMDQL